MKRVYIYRMESESEHPPGACLFLSTSKRYIYSGVILCSSIIVQSASHQNDNNGTNLSPGQRQSRLNKHSTSRPHSRRVSKH